MVERVKHIIETEFPGAEATIEQIPGSRLSGSIVWSGFEGVDDWNRQMAIRNVLAEMLGEEASEIGLLITNTPHEMEVMLAA